MKTIFKVLATMAAALSVASCCTSQPAEECAAAPSAMDVIMTRASVRDYTSEPVSDEMIEQLLKAGMAAPSAVNYQPWRFVVVTDREVLDGIAKTNPNARMVLKAPLAIVVCGETEWALGGREASPNGFWSQDCSAATENILLAAHALGLGAVWTGTYPGMEKVEAVRNLLGIPENVAPLCTIVIGHPAAPVEPKDKFKPEYIHYNRW